MYLNMKSHYASYMDESVHIDFFHPVRNIKIKFFSCYQYFEVVRVVLPLSSYSCIFKHCYFKHSYKVESIWTCLFLKTQIGKNVFLNRLPWEFASPHLVFTLTYMYIVI